MIARWRRGDAEIEALLASGDVQRLTGGGLAMGASAVGQGVGDAGHRAIGRDPNSAFVLNSASQRSR